MNMGGLVWWCWEVSWVRMGYGLRWLGSLGDQGLVSLQFFKKFYVQLNNYFMISPVSEGSGDFMILSSSSLVKVIVSENAIYHVKMKCHPLTIMAMWGHWNILVCFRSIIPRRNNSFCTRSVKYPLMLVLHRSVDWLDFSQSRCVYPCRWLSARKA